MQLSSTGPSNILPPSWYFMQVQDHVMAWNTTSSLYGNIPINHLNEWNLDKLGWYKTSKRKKSIMSRQMQKPGKNSFYENNKDDQVTAHTFSQIKRALNVQVQNCAGNAHSYAVKIIITLCVVVYFNDNI